MTDSLLTTHQIDHALDEAKLGYLRAVAPDLSSHIAIWLDALLAQPRNLSGIREPAAAVAKHAIEPLRDWADLLVADLPLPDGPLIDIGSGNGAPGLPLALSQPHRPTTLLDSRETSIAFLDEVIGQLGLNRITTQGGRAETVAHDALREQFAVAVTRATAPPLVALELAVPFLQIGGCAVLWTAKLDQEQIVRLDELARQLGAELIPLETRTRVVVATKLRPTPARYPRPWTQLRRLTTPR